MRQEPDIRGLRAGEGPHGSIVATHGSYTLLPNSTFPAQRPARRLTSAEVGPTGTYVAF